MAYKKLTAREQLAPRPRVVRRYPSRDEALAGACLDVLDSWVREHDRHVSLASYMRLCRIGAARHHGLRWGVTADDVARGLERTGKVSRFGPTAGLTEEPQPV